LLSSHACWSLNGSDSYIRLEILFWCSIQGCLLAY
jgi:hypothetical protein